MVIVLCCCNRKLTRIISTKYSNAHGGHVTTSNRQTSQQLLLFRYAYIFMVPEENFRTLNTPGKNLTARLHLGLWSLVVNKLLLHMFIGMSR